MVDKIKIPIRTGPYVYIPLYSFDFELVAFMKASEYRRTKLEHSADTEFIRYYPKSKQVEIVDFAVTSLRDIGLIDVICPENFRPLKYLKPSSEKFKVNIDKRVDL